MFATSKMRKLAGVVAILTSMAATGCGGESLVELDSNSPAPAAPIGGAGQGTGNQSGNGNGTGGRNETRPGGAGQADQSDDAIVRSLTAEFGDKFLEFGRSESGGGGNFLTSNTEMVLCASGRFGRLVTTSFSSTINSSTFDDQALGTWRIVLINGAPVLELSIEQNSDQNGRPVEQFAIEQDNAGNLFIAGDVVRRFDPAEQDCRQ